MTKQRMKIVAILALVLLSQARGQPADAKATPKAGTITEEVRIPSEPGVVLAGTLTKPGGRKVQRLPVVLTIAGTGAWTRGRMDSIRSRLLEQGIATLEYDKRGLGESTGTFVDTLPAMQRDVAAAIAFLRSRRDVDAARIALVGRSQGAVAAPNVAAEMPDIAAVVMLSGPVGGRGELFFGILRTHLTNAGRPIDAIERVLLAAGKWMEARSRAADQAEIASTRGALTSAFADAGFARARAEQFVTTLDTPVVLSMYETAPDQALARIAAPILVVYGSKDELIVPALHAPAAVKALSANPDAMVVVVPGLDHTLARVSEDRKSDGTSSRDQTAPAAIDLVVGWLSTRLAPSTQSR